MKISPILIAFMLLFTAFVFMTTVPETTEAASLFVSSSGSTYTTIQAAIDAANPNDVIVVGPGTYHESLSITTDHLTIRGNSSSTCKLLHHYVGSSVSDFAAGVNVTASFISISGLNITVSGDYCYGIKLTGAGDNYGSIFSNNVSTNGDHSFGIWAYQHSSILIRHNNVSTVGPNYPIGVIMTGSYNSAVTNNTIVTQGDHGLGVQADSGGRDRVEGNTIFTGGLSSYGVYVSLSSEGNVSRNHVSTSGSSSHGIRSFSSNGGNISDNTVRVSGLNSRGISVESRPTVHIDRNNINSTSNLPGIYLTNSRNCRLTNNTLNTSGASGIDLHQNCHDTLVSNNTLHTGGSSSHGIVLFQTSHANVIGNTITTVGDSSAGIYFTTGSLGNNITSDTILTRGASSHGIELADPCASNNFLLDSAVTTGSNADGYHGMNTGASNTLTGCTLSVSGTGSAGLFQDQYGVEASNSTIRSVSGSDVSASSSASVHLVNCTFSEASLSATGASVITVDYYHTIHVDDAYSREEDTEAGIADVSVTARDALATVRFTGITNSTGNISGVLLTAFRFDGSYDRSMQDYSFRAEKWGYDVTTTTMGATLANRTIDILLDDTTAPRIYGLSITPEDNITVNHSCALHSMMNETHPVHSGFSFLYRIGGNATHDLYSSYAESGNELIRTPDPLDSNVTSLDLTFNGTSTTGAYISDALNRTYVNAWGFEYGAQSAVSMDVYYSNTTYTNEYASLNLWPNGTIIGLYIDGPGMYFPAGLIDPTASITPVDDIFPISRADFRLDAANVDTGPVGPAYSISSFHFALHPAVPSGRYVVVSFDMDRGDNVGFTVGNLTVDNSGPDDILLTSTPLVNGMSKGTVTLTATSPSIDVRDASFFRSTDGVHWEFVHKDTTPSSGFLYVWDSSALPDRAEYFRVVMNDTWGNMNTSAPLAVETDNSLPSLTMSGVEAYSHDLVEINVTTPDTNIIWCQFSYSDDNLTWTGLFNDTTSTDGWGAALDTRTISDGVLYIRARMGDSAINTNTAVLMTIVDNTAPVLTNGTPSSANWMAAGPVNISLDVNESNPVTVVFRIRGNDNSSAVSFNDTNGSDGFSVTADPFALGLVPPDGIVNVSATCIDMTAHSSVLWWTMRVDALAPSIDITPLPAGSIGRNTSLNVSFHDLNSGVASVTMTYDGPLNGTLYGPAAASTPISVIFPAALLPDGNYTISALAVDAVGNTGNTSLKLTVRAPIPSTDNTPPGILSTFPVNGSANVPLNTTVSITFSEPMNTTSVNRVLLLYPWANYDPVWSSNDTVIALRPNTLLWYNTTYSIIIDAGATDLAGNILAGVFQFEFTTLPEPVGNGTGNGTSGPNGTVNQTVNQTVGPNSTGNDTGGDDTLTYVIISIVLILVAVLLFAVGAFLFMRMRSDREDEVPPKEEEEEEIVNFGGPARTGNREDVVEVDISEEEDKIVEADEVFAEEKKREIRRERELKAGELDDLEDLDELDDEDDAFPEDDEDDAFPEDDEDDLGDMSDLDDLDDLDMDDM